LLNIYLVHVDLHSIGGLDPLLGYLKNSHAGIRAKAAEVVSTVVQNNPKSQQLVMESNGLEPLLTNFRSDPSMNARTKALGAISCKLFLIKVSCIAPIICTIFLEI
jgi:hsp70-interacting protein